MMNAFEREMALLDSVCGIRIVMNADGIAEEMTVVELEEFYPPFPDPFTHERMIYAAWSASLYTVAAIAFLNACCRCDLLRKEA